MPTKRPRLNVTFPDKAYYDVVERISIAKRHSMSDLMLVAFDEYLEKRKKESGLFSPSQLREGEQNGAVDFDTPSPLPPGQVSGNRGQLGGGKNG